MSSSSDSSLTEHHDPDIDTNEPVDPSVGEDKPTEEVENIPVESEADQAVENYLIRPKLEDKFKPLSAKEIIHNVLYDQLSSKEYDASQVDTWTKELSNLLLEKVKTLKFDSYKYIAHVVIGAKNGAGVKSGFKCIWDPDADSFASDSFVNDSLFCHAAIFALYIY